MNGAVAVFERSEKKIFEFSDKGVKENKGLSCRRRKIFEVLTSQQAKLNKNKGKRKEKEGKGRGKVKKMREKSSRWRHLTPAYCIQRQNL